MLEVGCCFPEKEPLRESTELEPSCAHRAKVVHNLGVAANGTSTEKREALQIAQTKDKRET
jgi:hypothetical protein